MLKTWQPRPKRDGSIAHGGMTLASSRTTERVMEMDKPRLPERLHAAYDWTQAAGELDDLRRKAGNGLAAYCRASAANARDCGDMSVRAEDLDELSGWLKRAV